jgi:stearoyl-coA desaturase, putative (fragment)
MWGLRPYDKNIEPRENLYVSYAAFGEGFHNYHHTFPWDYSTSEMGYKLNVTKIFIDVMAKCGQAYNLKQVTPAMIEARKKKNLEN